MCMVHTCQCVGVFMYTHVGARSGVFSICLYLIALKKRKSLLLNGKGPIPPQLSWAGWTANPQDQPVSTLNAGWVIGTHDHARLLCGGSNSGSHARRVSTLTHRAISLVPSFSFLRFAMQLRLYLNSLRRLGWPQTCPFPASACHVLGRIRGVCNRIQLVFFFF